MGFTFESAERIFSSIALKIVNESKIVASVSAKIQNQEQLIVHVTSMIDPRAALIERAAFALFGKASKAVTDAGAAASCNGLNLALDEAEVVDLKGLLSYLKSHPFAQYAGISSNNSSQTAVAKVSISDISKEG